MSESNLDIVFCVDNTGSMSSYIQQVQMNIKNIIEQIVKSEKANVRFGLVHYRDHTDTYLVKKHEFTSEMQKVIGYVNQMSADGGGDGPEAVAPAFKALNELEWRKVSTKIAVFIADAPPHGIEPSGDNYPNGDPKGIDPLAEVRELVTKEVMIYSVGCEPAINSFVNARAFMKAVADMSGGRYLSLAQANILSDIIIYGAREEINLEKYANQIEQEVTNVQKLNPKMEVQNVYAMAATNLQAQGICTPQMQVDEVVDKSAFANSNIFTKADNLKAAKAQLPKSSYGPSNAYSPMPYSLSSISPSPPSALPSSSFSAYPAPPSFASAYAPPAAYPSPSFAPSPAYGGGMPQAQQAQLNVAPISMEQVQRLYERKQPQPQSKP